MFLYSVYAFRIISSDLRSWFLKNNFYELRLFYFGKWAKDIITAPFHEFFFSFVLFFFSVWQVYVGVFMYFPVPPLGHVFLEGRSDVPEFCRPLWAVMCSICILCSAHIKVWLKVTHSTCYIFPSFYTDSVSVFLFGLVWRIPQPTQLPESKQWFLEAVIPH